MNFNNAEHEFSSQPNESEKIAFIDKFKDLLPGVEFEEPIEMLEARTAVLEALIEHRHNPDFLQSVWIEYAKICEQIVDDRSETEPDIRAQLQIAILIHKALIFREAKDMQHYYEDLIDVEEYASNMSLDKIAEAVGAELDDLTH